MIVNQSSDYNYKKLNDDKSTSYFTKQDAIDLEQILKRKNKDQEPFFSISDWLPQLQYKTNDEHFKNIFGALIITLIAIPQSLSQVAMARLPNKLGIYTTIAPPIIFSLLTKSREIMVGCIANTFLMLDQATREISDPDELVSYAFCINLQIGILMILMGIFKLDFIENIYPQPMMTGFLSASALAIFLDQFASVLQVKISGDFLGKIQKLIYNINTMNVASTIMGGMIFIIAFVSSKLKKKYFPNSVLLSCIPSIMILFGTFISIMFNLNDKYDLKSAKDIPSGYPLPSWPVINFNLLQKSFMNALFIGIVSFSEHYLLSKKISQQNGYEISSQKEIITIGLTNFLGCFLNAAPSFASLSRSAISQQIGVNSQLTGFLSGFFTLISVLLLIEQIRMIPLTLVSGLICSSVLQFLPSFDELKLLFLNFKSDFIMMTLTFCLCLFTEVANGFVVCMLISMLWIIKKFSEPIWNLRFNNNELLQNEDDEENEEKGVLNIQQSDLSIISNIEKNNLVKQESLGGSNKNVIIIQLRRDLCYANITSLIRQLKSLQQTLKKDSQQYNQFYTNGNFQTILIIQIQNIKTIDYTALYYLKSIISSLKKNQINIYFSDANQHIKNLMLAMNLNENIVSICDQSTNKIIQIVQNNNYI